MYPFPERAAVNPRKVIRKRFLCRVEEVPHESTIIRVAVLFLVTLHSISTVNRVFNKLV